MEGGKLSQCFRSCDDIIIIKSRLFLQVIDLKITFTHIMLYIYGIYVNWVIFSNVYTDCKYTDCGIPCRFDCHWCNYQTVEINTHSYKNLQQNMCMFDVIVILNRVNTIAVTKLNPSLTDPNNIIIYIKDNIVIIPFNHFRSCTVLSRSSTFVLSM